MKYALRGITAEELSYTMNRIKMDKDTKIEIKPQFSRTVRRVQENDKIWFLSLEVKVESSEEAPKPFNIKARLVGVFEAEGHRFLRQALFYRCHVRHGTGSFLLAADRHHH